MKTNVRATFNGFILRASTLKKPRKRNVHVARALGETKFAVTGDYKKRATLYGFIHQKPSTPK